MAHVPEAVLVCAVQIFPFDSGFIRHFMPSLGDENLFFFQCHIGLVTLEQLAAGFRKEGLRSHGQFGSVT